MAVEYYSEGLEYSPIQADPYADARINRPLNDLPKTEQSFSKSVYNSLMNSFPALLADRLTNNVVYDNFNMDKVSEGEKTFDKWDAFNNLQLPKDQIYSYDSEVNSYHDALKWHAKLQEVQKRKKELSQAGYTGAALQFYSDLALSPTGIASMALPFGILAKGGLAIRSSKSLAAGAAIGSAYSLEKRLVDPSFSLEETKSNILASTALLGIIGSATPSLFRAAEQGVLSSGKDDVLNSFADKFHTDSAEIYGPSSKYYNASKSNLSAAGAGFNFEPAGPKFAQAATRIAAIMTPANRVANFTTQESKNFFSKIAGRPTYYTKGEAIGQAAPDSVAELRMPVEMEYQRTVDSIRGDFKSFINETADPGTKQKFVDKIISKMQPNQSLQNAIDEWYAVVQNEELSIEDIASMADNEPGPFRHVYKAALKAREQSAKEIKENIELGIEGAVERKNYGVQMTFDKNAAKSDTNNLYETLKEDATNYLDEIKTKYVNEYKDIGKMRQAMEREIDEYARVNKERMAGDSKALDNLALEIEDAKSEMEEIIAILDNIEDGPALLASKMLTEIIHGKSPSVTYMRGSRVSEIPGFFMHRKLNPLKYQKWAERRPEVLFQIRGRQVGTRRAMKRLYGHSVGRTARAEYSLKMDELIAARREAEKNISIDNSIKEKIKRKIKKEATADDLAAEKNSVLKQFDDLLESHLGQYMSEFYSNHPYLATGLDAMKTWNEVSMLGNVVAGSIGEHAAIIMHHGITSTMPEYKKVMKNLLSSKEFYSATVKELQAMDHAFEWAYFEMIQDIIGQGGNIGDKYVSGYAVMQNLKKYTHLLNGLTIWDHFNRLVVAKTQMSVLSKNLKKIANGKASKYEISDMAKLGISEGQAKKIVSELEAGGEEIINGLSVLRPEKMSKAIAERMKIALTNDIYRTALKVRTGDIPISMAHPAVALLTQFKSWPILATQKYMIPLMQRSDGSAMAAAATLAGFGVLSYIVKEKMAGRGLEDQNMADILYGGITQSGVVGITPEIFLDWAANRIGVEGGSAKYIGINPLIDTLIGPTATVIGRIDQASKILPGGDSPTDWTYQSMWKLLPLSNHPGFNLLNPSNE